MSKTFYAALGNSLAAFIANTFVWFAVTFWAYLETRSVIVTSVMAGIYLITVALSGFFLGSIVDRYKKRRAMLLSSVSSFLLYAVALGIYTSVPAQTFTSAASPVLWAFITLALFGAIAGNMRSIALSPWSPFSSPRSSATGLTASSAAPMAWPSCSPPSSAAWRSASSACSGRSPLPSG